MVTKLIGFQKDTVHITVSSIYLKLKLDKGEVNGGLMIDFLKAVCILLDLYNEKLHEYSLPLWKI